MVPGQVFAQDRPHCGPTPIECLTKPLLEHYFLLSAGPEPYKRRSRQKEIREKNSVVKFVGDL